MDSINNKAQHFSYYSYRKDQNNFLFIINYFNKCFNEKRHLLSRNILSLLNNTNIPSKYEKIQLLKNLKRHYYKEINTVYFIGVEKEYLKNILSKIDFCIYKIKNQPKKGDDFIHRNYRIRKMIAKNHSYKKRYDPNYMTISTKEIYLEQDAEDCFCVSFLQIFLIDLFHNLRYE